MPRKKKTESKEKVKKVPKKRGRKPKRWENSSKKYYSKTRKCCSRKYNITFEM